MTKSQGKVKKTTVDIDYNKHIKQFTHDQKQLSVQKKKLTKLRTKYAQLKARPLTDLTDDEIKLLHQYKSDITTISQEIERTEELSNVTDFFLKTGELLIDYYDNDEKHAQTTQNRQKTTSDSTEGNLLHFFCTKTPTSTSETKQSPIPSHQKADLYEQYLIKTDPHHVADVEYNRTDDYCSKCGTYRELVSNEALLICPNPNCGEQVETLMESDKPSYRDPPHENMFFAYKRINHFKEQLAHFQAKETTKIPQEIYDIILVEFKKEKKKDLATLTRSLVKRYLQKYTHLGYNKYYENINQIICHLNGIQPFSIRPEIEEKMCMMFQMIQEPFERHCPHDRTNFLSYSYVIYKFCQLLGYVEFLPYFGLLKSKDKLRQQDKIWKKICLELGWKFYPSAC